MKTQTALICYFCEGRSFTKIFSYTKPPLLETKFQFSTGAPYDRAVHRCNSCGHFISIHSMNMNSLYGGDYVSSTYGGEDGIKQAFKRIISLIPEKSDNEGRIKRILEFSEKRFRKSSDKKPKLLDIGSGLGVFIYGMKKAGWDCTAVDPDPRSVQHAQNTIGVRAAEGDYMALSFPQKFDVITFNKVLEHVENPIGMLAKSVRELDPAGFVYVEVPDGEAACSDGPEREEFSIDHHHIFSFTSLSLLASHAGLSVCTAERLKEPSTKYTLRAFLTLPREAA